MDSEKLKRCDTKASPVDVSNKYKGDTHSNLLEPSSLNTDNKSNNTVSIKESKSYSGRDFLVDFIAGGVSGAAMLISYYPFDTIKVRMQNNIKSERFLSSIHNCYKYEGLLGFFKGMSLPLYTVSIINAASLVGNEFSKKLLHVQEDRNLSLAQSFLCGYMAGMCTSLIATPVEVVKCRLQIQTETKTNSYYKGVFDLMMKVYREGGFKALFKGNVPTYFRETLGYSGQFGCYQYLKLKFAEFKKVDYDSLSNLDIVIAGSCAGLWGWVVSYPFDTVKTIIQVGSKTEMDGVGAEKAQRMKGLMWLETTHDNTEVWKYKKTGLDGGMFNCLRMVYASSGVRGLYAGFLPCAISGFYSYGIMFFIYEQSKASLERKLL